MSEIRPGGASPSRAVLTALRAAAVLIVATGLNDIIAGAIDTYEPLYLYLGAVALITLLDGMLIGAVSAAFATFLYTLLFGPRPPVLEASVGVPAAGGALVVVVSGAIAAGWRRFGRERRIDRPKKESEVASGDTPLLEASILTPAEEIVTALEEMRADLRGALVELSAARERERALEHELRTARTSATDEAARIVDGANRAIDALSARVQEVEERSRSREVRLEQAWVETRDALGAQIRTLESELLRERSRADSADRAEAEVVAARLEISQLTQERDVLRGELAELRPSLEKLKADREGAEATSARLAQRIAELESELVEREATGAGQATFDALKAERDAAQAASASLARRVVELEAALARREEKAIDPAAMEALRSERDAAQAASARVAERVVELETALAEREEKATDAAAMETLRSERDAAQAASARMAERVMELESALVGREENAIDAAAMETLRQELDAAQSTSASLAQRVAELEAAIEAADDERSDDVIAARLEASQLAQRVTELQAALDAMTAERDQLQAAGASAQAQFDAKLQSIVAHLAEDHEQDLGNAIMEKEAARAEARGMTQRLQQLQQKIEEEREKWLSQKQALTDKITQAEERAARAVEDTTRVMSDARVSWQAELERLRARVAELEQRPSAAAAPPRVDLRSPIPMPPPSEAAPAHRPRIVVVHPDMELREAARSSLVRVGYDVATAADGLEGLRVAIAMNPDVVIADTQMPKMDGRELCQLLKSQEKTAHIKIVLLTRTAGERVDGADQVLKKPVPFDILRGALTELLAR